MADVLESARKDRTIEASNMVTVLLKKTEPCDWVRQHCVAACILKPILRFAIISGLSIADFR